MSARVELEPRARERLRLGAVPRWLERDGILVVLVGGLAIVLLARVRSALAADSWTALLSGRYVAERGLPWHDVLTVWSAGRSWVDQQWLAQLVLYELERLGGLATVLLVYVGLSVGGFAAAAALARSRGGSARSVTWVALLAVVIFFPGASVMRAQSFAYLLFVAVVWLAAADARAPSRRGFLVFPLLALWANLHGSVLVGAAVVSVYGAVGLAGCVRHSAGRRTLWRPALFALLPWLMVLASPYGLELAGYYHRVLLQNGFGDFVSEWQPTTLSLVTAPFYVLALGGTWLLARVRGRILAFEQLAFVLVMLLALTAVRNLVWFALLALAFLPGPIDALRGPVAGDPERVNRWLGGAVLAAAVVAAVATAARSDTWLLRDYPVGAADATASAAGATGRVFSNERFSDWLIWTNPRLGGRVAFDARFELLTKEQLRAVAGFRSLAGPWQATIRRYGTLVLDPVGERDVVQALVRGRRAGVLYRDPHVVVLRRR